MKYNLLINAIRDRIESAFEEDLKGCCPSDLHAVYDMCFSKDIRHFCNVFPNKNVPELVFERAENAGIIGICIHLWNCVIEHGRKKVAELDEKSEINLYCCIKTDCYSDRIEKNENGYYVKRVHDKRCMYHLLDKHFNFITDVILRIIRDRIVDSHPSQDGELISLVTGRARDSHAFFGRLSPAERHMENLFNECVSRARLAITPVYARFSVPGDDGWMQSDGTALIALPITDYHRYDIDIFDETRVILEHHRREHKCTLLQKCEHEDDLNNKIDQIVRRHNGKIGQFVLVADCNQSYMKMMMDHVHVVKDSP